MKRFISIFFSLAVMAQVCAQTSKVGQLKPTAKPKDRPSVALVLAGGGAKGYAQLPVLELIEELGIPVDMVIGTSVGSIIGGLYGCGYSAQSIKQLFWDMKWNTLFDDKAISLYENLLQNHSSFENLITIDLKENFKLKIGSGISSGQAVYQLLKELTLKIPSDGSFDDLPVPFRCVGTNLLTGEAEVFDSGDIAEAIRCSMSLPAAFSPFEVNGQYYVDGGLRFNLATNVARELGYDYVIAVDISATLPKDPKAYDTSPVSLIMSLNGFCNTGVHEECVKLADICITPTIDKVGVVDFGKAHDIYKIGQEAAQNARPALIEFRQKLGIKDDQAAQYSQNRRKYENMKYSVADNVEVVGSYDADVIFINNKLQQLKGEVLNTSRLESLFKEIYRTGNYRYVTVRNIKGDQDTSLIQVRLTKNDSKSSRILIGTSFEQSVARLSLSKIIISPAFQLRGFTGPGSLLSLSLETVNQFSGELFYFQPFNPYVFFETGVTGGLSVNTLFGEGYFKHEHKYVTAHADFGFRTLLGSLLKAGGQYSYKDAEYVCYDRDQFLLAEVLYGELDFHHKNTAGPFLSYTYTGVDFSAFPTKGFRGHLMADCTFPLACEFRNPFVNLEAGFQFAVPLGQRFSWSLRGVFATEVTGNLMKDQSYVPVAGKNTYDRIYAPQVSASERHGAHKVGFSTSIMFKPVKQLTILGGDLFLIASGTISNVAWTYDKLFVCQPLFDNRAFNPNIDVYPFDSYSMLWTASLGAAIRIRDCFSIVLRFGASNDNFNRAGPFLAIDIGSIKF